MVHGGRARDLILSLLRVFSKNGSQWVLENAKYLAAFEKIRTASRSARRFKFAASTSISAARMPFVAEAQRGAGEAR